MRVFITGATGFVGSNISRHMLDAGHEVHILIRKKSDTWRIDDIKDQITPHFSDISDKNGLLNAMSVAKPEIVYHTATYGGFPHQTDFNKTVQTNIVGVINLIQACVDNGVECLVNTGTSSEYGICDGPMREDMVLNPLSMYGATKATASVILKNTDKLPIVTLRLFSPFGFYEDNKRLIPYLILSYMRNMQPKLSSKNFVRDFIFIEDVMKSYEKASDPNLGGNIFNIGTGKQHTILDVVSFIKNCTKSRIDLIWDSGQQRKNEPKNWFADTTKSKKILKWHPKHSLEYGIKKTIEWFRLNSKFYM